MRASVGDPDPRRVVVDTNVLISAALVAGGTPARLVQRVLERGMLVFSPATLAEFRTRLWRPKFDRYITIEQRQRIVHDLHTAAVIIEVSAAVAQVSFCPDADDDKFVHAALAGRAPWLVTGDGDLLEMAPVAGLAVVSPATALGLAGFLS